MCLAGAEELAVKKAVIKKNMSKQTTSKLSADVWKKYENALFQLNAMPGDSKKNVSNQNKEERRREKEERRN